MDISDNFHEGEIELNWYGAEYNARPNVDEGTNPGDNQTHKRCIRKGDVVCFVKDENINMAPSVPKKISTTHHSFGTDSKTHISTETDNVPSGESLYKTFIFEESLNDTDTQKCIAFWKSVMEKNLKPIKCTIIEDKKRRHKETKAEPEKIHSPAENTDTLVKEATDKVHAEYKQMWKTALKEIQKKKLDQVKMVGRARCKLCESIEGPMEEYVTEADNATIKEEVKRLNEWAPVSIKGIKRLEKKKSPTPKINKRIAEKDMNEYKFVNVIEEKKKTGAYKLWRSNKVKPPCACGKDNCECNINPAIISVRGPLGVPTPTTSNIEGKRSTPLSLEGKRSAPVYQKISEPGTVETKSKSFPGTAKFDIPEAPKSIEEKKSEPLYAARDGLILTKPSLEEKKSKETPYYKDQGSLGSSDSTKKKHSDPICSMGPPPDVSKRMPRSISNDDIDRPASQTSDVIRLMSEGLANEISAIFVKKATPCLKLLAANILREVSAISTVSAFSAYSALPYAEESVFLKAASEDKLQAEISAMFMRETMPQLTQMMSETFMSQLEEIITKTNPHLTTLHAEHDDDVTSVSGLMYDYPPPPPEPAPAKPAPVQPAPPQPAPPQPTPPKREPSPMEYSPSELQSMFKKKPDDEKIIRNLDSLLTSPVESGMVGRQLSFMLPTGEVEIVQKTIPTEEDLTWEKPKIEPPRTPLAKRKDSLEKFKKKITKGGKKGQKTPSPLGSFSSDNCNGSDNISNNSIDKNLACLIAKEEDGSNTSTVPMESTIQESSMYQREQLERHKEWKTHESEESNLNTQQIQLVKPPRKVVPHKAVGDKQPYLAKDSIYVQREHISKSHKGVEEKESEKYTSNELSQKVQLGGDTIAYPRAADIKNEDTNLPKDSVYVTKERITKQKEHKDEIPVSEYEIPREGAVHMATTPVMRGVINPTQLKDSMYVHKGRRNSRNADENSHGSQELYETDYEVKKASSASEHSKDDFLKKESPYIFRDRCDPCYCTNCPCENTLLTTMTSTKRRKLTGVCPLNPRPRTYRTTEGSVSPTPTDTTIAGQIIRESFDIIFANKETSMQSDDIPDELC